jgi:hypothetical protein
MIILWSVLGSADFQSAVAGILPASFFAKPNESNGRPARCRTQRAGSPRSPGQS